MVLDGVEDRPAREGTQGHPTMHAHHACNVEQHKDRHGPGMSASRTSTHKNLRRRRSAACQVATFCTVLLDRGDADHVYTRHGGATQMVHTHARIAGNRNARTFKLYCSRWQGG